MSQGGSVVAVLLTVSETLTGAAFADSLAGGGTGIDLGSVVNGQFAPIIDQPTNDGKQDVFIRHDATVDPITDVRTFLQTYGVGTGFTYGGANSAAADYTKSLNMGNASVNTGGASNSPEGTKNGLHIDMDWQVSTASQFSSARYGTNARVYGESGGAATGQGRNLATAFNMHVDAMSRNNGGTEVDAGTPVTGKIGKTGDTVLGDRAHPRMRFFLRTDETDGGILQVEWVIAYSFTA
jgi:hypothetical protein